LEMIVQANNDPERHDMNKRDSTAAVDLLGADIKPYERRELIAKGMQIAELHHRQTNKRIDDQKLTALLKEYQSSKPKAIWYNPTTWFQNNQSWNLENIQALTVSDMEKYPQMLVVGEDLLRRRGESGPFTEQQKANAVKTLLMILAKQSDGTRADQERLLRIHLRGM